MFCQNLCVNFTVPFFFGDPRQRFYHQMKSFYSFYFLLFICIFRVLRPIIIRRWTILLITMQCCVNCGSLLRVVIQTGMHLLYKVKRECLKWNLEGAAVILMIQQLSYWYGSVCISKRVHVKFKLINEFVQCYNPIRTFSKSPYKTKIKCLKAVQSF